LAAVLLAGAVLLAAAMLLAGESSRAMLASARVSCYIHNTDQPTLSDSVLGK